MRGVPPNQCVQPQTLSRRLDVLQQYNRSVAEHPPGVLPLQQRVWVASPYRTGGAALVKEEEEGAATADAASSALKAVTRLAKGDRDAAAEEQHPVALIPLPISAIGVGETVPPLSTCGSSTVDVVHATCEGPFSTILLDVSLREAVRVARRGAPLAIAAPCAIGGLNFAAASSRLTTVSRKDALHPLDETPLSVLCDRVVTVPATAFTIFVASATSVHVVWNASDVLDDGVVGGSELPQAGSVVLELRPADDAILLQTTVLADFQWRIEPVK
jgi:hypothetical protein